MEHISRQELAKLSLDELHGLLHQSFNALAGLKSGSAAHHQAQANLSAIKVELRSREP